MYNMNEKFNPDLLLSLFEDILGEPRRHNDVDGQISFDCPTCSYEIKELDEGDGKGNLEINYHQNVYKCWACAETHGTHGTIRGLVYNYGNKTHKRQLELVLPNTEVFKKKTQSGEVLELPKDYVMFNNASQGVRLTPDYKRALNYLKKRGVTNEMMKKYKIGISLKGKYAKRIIIPSYDDGLNLNFFVTRSWYNGKLKYLNPKVSKDTLIFNEYLIDWDEDIYICEGVFDALFLPNAIPLLGKYINEYLWEKLYNEAKGLIYVALDGDAWEDTKKVYHRLNGGKLHGRIRAIKLPEDKDIGDLKGAIPEGSIMELEPQ